MERNGRRAAALAAFHATPVPLTSRQKEDRFWCDPLYAGVSSFAGRTGVDGLEPFGYEADWGDVGWCGVDLRSGH
jgi:hypothetical protein